MKFKTQNIANKKKPPVEHDRRAAERRRMKAMVKAARVTPAEEHRRIRAAIA